MFELVEHIKDTATVVALFTTREKGIVYLERRGYSRDQGKVCGNGLVYTINPGDFYELFPVKSHPIDPE